MCGYTPSAPGHGLSNRPPARFPRRGFYMPLRSWTRPCTSRVDKALQAILATSSALTSRRGFGPRLCSLPIPPLNVKLVWCQSPFRDRAVQRTPQCYSWLNMMVRSLSIRATLRTPSYSTSPSRLPRRCALSLPATLPPTSSVMTNFRTPVSSR